MAAVSWHGARRSLEGTGVLHLAVCPTWHVRHPTSPSTLTLERGALGQTHPHFVSQGPLTNLTPGLHFPCGWPESQLREEGNKAVARPWVEM